jgi:hypothetical protein
MLSRKDIKILLLAGYAAGYIVAVSAPIFIDPLHKSHVVYSSRNYPHAILCVPIFLLLFTVEIFILKSAKTTLRMYLSACVFLTSIAISLPIFLPEFPHQNLFAVGTTTTFLSGFTIFVWSIGDRINLSEDILKSAGVATFDYIKAVFTFMRQAAFAGVALFGALFFAAFATEFKYDTTTVTDKSDQFWLMLNTSLQLTFYTTYLVVGSLRYLFMMALKTLSDFKYVAAQIDRRARNKTKLDGDAEEELPAVT